MTTITTNTAVTAVLLARLARLEQEQTLLRKRRAAVDARWAEVLREKAETWAEVRRVKAQQHG